MEPLVIERTYNAPIEKLWSALTDNAQMKQWYFQLEAFKPEVGFEFQFSGSDQDKVFVHLCKVIEVIPGKKLVYSWRYKDYEGDSLVTFELYDEGDKTRVKLTHEGLETFPQNNSSFSGSNFKKGWNEILGRSLKEFVEKV